MPKAKKATKKESTKKIKELRIDAKGNYLIETKQEAVFALNQAVDLTDEIDQILIDNKMKEKEANLGQYRKALAEYQDEREILELVDGDARSLLIERTSNQWILTDDDIPENLDESQRSGVKSLTAIMLEKWPKSPKKINNIMRRITKQILVPTKLDEEVKDGTFTPNEIEPAFLNLVQTSYVKVGRKK